MSTWKLLPGWKFEGHNIGCAECIAIELVVIWLCKRSLHDCNVTIQSDNASAVAACWKEHSCNPSRNDSIWRIMVALGCSNLSISPVYISLAENKADALFHSCFSTASHLQST